MNIINKIKEYFYKWYYKNNSLSNLNIKDIIWARRYNNDKEKDKIAEGHKEGPFIIIKKDRYNTYGLYCTSNEHEEIKNNNIFLNLNRIKYNFKCDSYVCTTSLYKLTDYNYIYTMAKLDDTDLNRIIKAIIINKKISLDIKYTLSKGDIILYNNTRYYIYSISNDNYNTYKIDKSNSSNIKINTTNYKIYFGTLYYLSKKNNYQLLDISSDEEIKLIDLLKNKWDKEKELRKTICEGKLIIYNKNYYYIYNIIKDDILSIRVYKKIDCEDNLKAIKIDSKEYYTNYQKLILNKNNPNYNIVAIAKTIEQINIKEQIDNHYKNKKVKKIKEIIHKRYIEGVMIYDTDTLNKYIIIHRVGNIITLLDILTYKVTKFDLTKGNNFDFYKKLSKLDYSNYRLKLKNKRTS